MIFASVFVCEDLSLDVPELESKFKGDQGNKLLTVNVNQDIVQKFFIKLKPNKAEGVDGFVSTLFVKLGDSVVYPLSLISTKSFSEGIVHANWRRANVT